MEAILDPLGRNDGVACFTRLYLEVTKGVQAQLQGVVFADPRFAATRAVLVRDHGAYIWGDDVMDAKRHTEVYHFLFEATVARRDRHPEGRR